MPRGAGVCADTMVNETVSVIIPVHNSMRTLPRCIQSLKEQTVPPMEILVVDNDSTDETESFMVEKMSQSDVCTIFWRMDGEERAKKKNEAARRARGKFLLFIDSDMYVEKDVIESCIAAHQGKNVSGVIIPEHSIGEGFWASCKSLERDCYLNDPLIEAARFVTKENFEKIGQYDESMVAAEDWDLHNKLKNIGEIKRINHFILHDEGTLSLTKTVSKKRYYGQTSGAYSQRYPALSKKQFGLSRALRLLSRVHVWGKHPLLALGMFYMKAQEFWEFKKAQQKLNNRIKRKKLEQQEE